MKAFRRPGIRTRFAWGVLLAAVTLRAAVAANPPETCAAIDADRLLETALQHGFGRAIAASRSDAGTCSTGQKLSVYSVVAGPVPITCEIRLLTGRLLAPNWTIANYMINGAHQRMAASANGSGLIRFKMTADSRGVAAVRVSRIVLQGPDCSDWQDAFSLSREP